MALTLGDNFSYQGAKPLDARLKYDTLAAMKAVADATMYDGCMAYCSATDKTYQWKSTNTVDESTGKWREFSSGGGGGSSYTAGDGIDITNDTISIDPMPAEDMDDVIDELPTGGNIAVAGYVPLGTLIPFYGETAPKFFLACDGSTYNKVDYPELANHLLSLTNNTAYIVDGDDTKFKVPDLRGEFIRGTGTNSHTNQGSGANVGVHQDGTQIPLLNITEEGSSRYIGGQFTNYSLYSPENYGYDWLSEPTEQNTWAKSDGKNTTSYVGRAITRPTNTSVLFCIAYKDIYSNPMNDYSTTEKVVGTWIDGKPLYQKTVQCITSPDTTETIIPITDYISDIEWIVKVDNLYFRSSYDNYLKGGRNVSWLQNGSGIPIIIFTYGTSLQNCTTYVTLQYTKSTT